MTPSRIFQACSLWWQTLLKFQQTSSVCKKHGLQTVVINRTDHERCLEIRKVEARLKSYLKTQWILVSFQNKNAMRRKRRTELSKKRYLQIWRGKSPLFWSSKMLRSLKRNRKSMILVTMTHKKQLIASSIVPPQNHQLSAASIQARMSASLT